MPTSNAAKAILVLLCAMSSLAMAGEYSSTECLTDEQRSDLLTRTMETGVVAVFDYRPAMNAARLARDAEATARQAWATCESEKSAETVADICAEQRATLKATVEARDAAEEKKAKAADEMKAKIAVRMKATREQFPSCGDAPRAPD